MCSHLSIPTYRYYGEGEVTVIVTVNSAGHVVRAKVLDEMSASDECMRSFAIRAARLSRFSTKAKANNLEHGEIVYEFKSIGTTETNIGYMGEPKAVVSGRSVNGFLPKPKGTTVSDITLWQSARKAALGAHFNMDADAPSLQKGAITYIFTM